MDNPTKIIEHDAEQGIIGVAAPSESQAIDIAYEYLADLVAMNSMRLEDVKFVRCEQNKQISESLFLYKIHYI